MDSPVLNIPEHNICLHPGDTVKLCRFSQTFWVVGYGWYSFGGNRPVCGWYLTDKNNPDTVKPLQLPDTDDIYLVEV